MEQEIHDYLDLHKEELLKDLCDFVGIPSVSGDSEQVQQALQFALKLGEKMGFQSHSLLQGQVGTIETGQGCETLGILSHVDVVDAGDRNAWKTDPFVPEIINGVIYGRGTLDDKGAVVAALYAMKAVSNCGKPFKKKVRLILGTQEESDWSDMRAYVAAYPPPDYGFSPDGEFPVCNIEKGSLDVDLIFPLSPCNCAEDGTFLSTVSAGTAHNIVPGTSRACLIRRQGGIMSEEIIDVTGKAVHSCQPEKGENAIFTMAGKLDGLSLSDNRLWSLLRMIRDKFSDLYGKKLGLYSDSEYVNGEFVHRNVFSPTMIAVHGGKLEVHINVRFGYGTDPDHIRGGLERLAAEYDGYLENISKLPAVYVSKDRPFVQAFATAYEEVTGRKNEFTLAYGGSYAKAMPNIVSWGPILPGEEDTCHEENEYISVDSLMANAKIYAEAINMIVFLDQTFL